MNDTHRYLQTTADWTLHHKISIIRSPQAGEKASHQYGSTVYPAASFHDARRLQRANRLREFIAAVGKRAHNDGELTTEIKQWIEWARTKADWINRLVRRSAPNLDASEPEPPKYWQF